MKRFILSICFLAFAASEMFADEAHRYTVGKIEVQSGVSTFGDVVSSNRTVARARLTSVVSPYPTLDVWFDLEDGLDYGKLKLSIFMTAVATGKKVEISTTDGDMGSMYWSIDTGWTTPVSHFCYLVALTSY